MPVPQEAFISFIQYLAARTTEWTRLQHLGKAIAMARYQHDVYAIAKTPRYLVLFDLQWKIIACQRLNAAADLRCAMATTINKLNSDGWMIEGAEKFGFVFLKRDGIRRLLILTERDPGDLKPQAFSPFK
jgi:hypothetical protein